MPRVILIEDDALVRAMLMHRLAAAGWGVIALRDAREIDVIISAAPVDLLVVDLGLPYMDGLALVEHLRAKGIETPVLVISGYDLPHLNEAVRGAGANDLLQKPFDQEVLLERMARLLAA